MTSEWANKKEKEPKSFVEKSRLRISKYTLHVSDVSTYQVWHVSICDEVQEHQTDAHGITSHDHMTKRIRFDLVSVQINTTTKRKKRKKQLIVFPKNSGEVNKNPILAGLCCLEI